MADIMIDVIRSFKHDSNGNLIYEEQMRYFDVDIFGTTRTKRGINSEAMKFLAYRTYEYDTNNNLIYIADNYNNWKRLTWSKSNLIRKITHYEDSLGNYWDNTFNIKCPYASINNINQILEFI